MIVGADAGREIRLGNQRLRVLSEGTDVHDVAVVDTVLPPGAGSGRHVHHGHEESFYVLEGTVRLGLDDQVVDAGPGGFILAERGQPHSFQNVGDGDARMLAVYSPASALSYIDDLAAIVAPDGSVDSAELAAFYQRFESAGA